MTDGMWIALIIFGVVMASFFLGTALGLAASWIGEKAGAFFWRRS